MEDQKAYFGSSTHGKILACFSRGYPSLFNSVYNPPTMTLSSMQSVSEMSQQMRDVRSQMEEDENLKVLMASLRGQNLSDADFADSNVKMRLVQVDNDDGEGLPLVYDPEKIADYWGRRPVALISRVLQLLGKETRRGISSFVF
jgi:aarF domain-containing kinase